MTTSSPETKLCLHIIGSQFGPISEAVSFEIFRFQKMTFARLSDVMKAKPKFSGRKDLSRVRDAMLVLVQHGCVHAEPPPLDEDAADDPRRAPERVVYSMHVTAILNRLRVPNAIILCRELYGDVGMMIAEEFFVHGRLGMGQLMCDVMARLTSPEGGPDPDQESKVRDVFEQMAADRFLQPVPALSTHARTGEAEADFGSKSKIDTLLGGASTAKRHAAGAMAAGASAASKKGRPTAGEKRKRSAMAAADDLPLELRMMMEASAQGGDEDSGGLSSKYAKLAPDNILGAVKTVPKVAGKGKKGKQGSIASSASSVAAVAVAAPSASSRSSSDSTALWTFGWSQCARYERNQLCMRVVRQRMGILAESILRIVLNRSIGTEIGAPELITHSNTFRVSELAALLTEQSDREYTPIQLKNILELLRQDKMGAVSLSRSEDSAAVDPSYVVNIRSILEFLRRKTVHSIVCEKFGDVSGRIFELLTDKKYLDQQRIGDLAIAPSRDVRTRMYDMYKANFIDYIDISKRGDFNTLSTVFLWYVNPTKFRSAVSDLVYKTIYNLRIRRGFECEQKKDVMELAQRSQGMKVDSTLAERFENFMVSINRLDHSILRLTETYVVLNVL